MEGGNKQDVDNGKGNKRRKAIDDLMIQQSVASIKKNRLSTPDPTVGGWTPPNYNPSNLQRPHSKHIGTSYSFPSNSHYGPSSAPARNKPLHQTLTPPDLSILHSHLSSVSSSPTVGNVRSGMMWMFPKTALAHDFVSVIIKRFRTSLSLSSSDPSELITDESALDGNGARECLGLLYLVNDVIHNANNSIIPGAFLWRNAIAGVLPEMLGRLGEFKGEKEGGGVDKGVRRVLESWDKFDVWEEGRGGVWRGFYEGKEVETEEEGVDGEEMTEEELKEFGIEWR